MKNLFIVIALIGCVSTAFAQSESDRLDLILDAVKSAPEQAFMSSSARAEAKNSLIKVLSRQLDSCLIGEELEKMTETLGEVANDFSCAGIIAAAGSTLSREEIQTIVQQKQAEAAPSKPATTVLK